MIPVSPAFKDGILTLVKQLLDKDVLLKREQAIVLLTASFLWEDSEAVRQAVIAAKQSGMTNDQITHVRDVVVALRCQRLAGWEGAPSEESANTSEASCGCQ